MYLIFLLNKFHILHAHTLSCDRENFAKQQEKIQLALSVHTLMELLLMLIIKLPKIKKKKSHIKHLNEAVFRVDIIKFTIEGPLY